MLLLKSFVENTGGYSELVSKTFNLYVWRAQVEQLAGGWTHCTGDGGAFMVAVCGDVHRSVSPARTIREFVTGVLLVPRFTLMWMICVW
ncbi:hypothetical protein [Escherichia coli]|uniref:hypothetical protein n=1 Tax=Escherichia coli TaxID=562 RepID=UPI003855FD87